MKFLTVYLGGPIAGCSDGEASDWRNALKQDKVHFMRGVDFLDPMQRDFRGIEGDHTNEIVDLDKRDIRSSDVLLMYAPKPSVGTSMEILYAFEVAETPCVVVVPEGAPCSPWIKRHATKIVKTIDEAMAWIYTTFSAELGE